jgi:ABC-type sugar transport system ATPase subunit
MATTLTLLNLQKSFGPTKALDGLSLTARAGEVLGIAGPNGAGKSTLIKILGVEAELDSGEILFDGKQVTPRHLRDRVAIVHQEVDLFPNLTVAENLLVGREATKVVRPRIQEREMAVVNEMELGRLLARPVDACTIATQQRIEIARALLYDADIFLFDEPNSALTDTESAELFRELRRLADADKVVVLVSHRVAELARNSDRVVVIRDGRVAATLEGDRVQEGAIANLLAAGGDYGFSLLRRGGGEKKHGNGPGRACTAERVVAELVKWSHRGGAFSDVHLKLYGGEIVAILGVEGSGGRELVRSLAGLEPAEGELKLPEADRAASAVGYLPASRATSLYSNLTIEENAVARLGKELTRYRLWLDRKRIKSVSQAACQKMRVHASSLRLPIRVLSGGNQQKVAIAAAIAPQPSVLLLEEPTRGVDLESKREIYRTLRTIAVGKTALLAFCTEVPEVFELADKAYVAARGRLLGPLRVRDFPSAEALVDKIAEIENLRTDG